MTKQAFRCISRTALAVVLAASLCPAPAFADDADTAAHPAISASDDADAQTPDAEGASDASPQADIATYGDTPNAQVDNDSAPAVQAETFDSLGDALAAAKEMDCSEAETVSIGFDPMFPDNGYTVTVEPAPEGAEHTAAANGDPFSGSIAAESATFEETLDAGWAQTSKAIDVSAFSFAAAEPVFAQVFRDYVEHILDRPELFNVRTVLNANLSADKATISSLVPSYLTTDPDTLATMQETYDTNVERALACIDDSMTDTSKVYALHDWLCNRATYNHSAVESEEASFPSFTAYGCMANGLGVCQSYTLAFSHLLNRAGIPNAPLLVTSMNHAWNLVRIDGSWYHIDATWDDGTDAGTTGNPDYRYFLKSGTWFAAPTDGSNAHSGWKDAKTTYGWSGSFTDSNRNLDRMAWKRYAPQGNKLCDFSQSATDGGLALVVKFDALKGGTPTEFYAQGWGGKGDYIYTFESPMLLDSLSDYPGLVDPMNKTFNDEFTNQRDGAFAFPFYVSGNYRIRLRVQDNLYGDRPVKTASLTTVPSLNDASYPGVAALSQSVAEQCLQELGNGADDYDKALWLHDYLIDTAAYDLRFINAEGVLARKLGNCESYHAAYCNLLKAVGIETGRIASTADNHVWTAVKLDGKWYQVDTTWDDENYATYPFDLRHIHFGLTDELMGLAHPGHTQATEGYESASLDDNYFIRSGAIDPHADQYADEIRNQLASGATSFTIEEKNKTYPGWTISYDGATKGIYNNLVAYELAHRCWETTVAGQKTYAVLAVSYQNKSNIAAGQSGGTFSFAISYVDGNHTHQWGDWTMRKSPSCSVAGEQKRSCTLCWLEESRSVPTTDHTWGSTPVVGKQPTCTSAGERRTECARCGAVKPGSSQTIAALGHSFGSWGTVKAPTCTAAGQKRHTCSRCGMAETQSVAALGHSWKTTATVDRQPTCTATGQKHIGCTRCSEVKPGSSQSIPALGHSFGAWTQVKAPTTQAEGQEARNCTRCSLRQTRPVAKLPSPAFTPGWNQTSGTWRYYHADGSLARNGWGYIEGEWYYFDSNGIMQTGWVYTGGHWYWLKSWGGMATGWQQIGGTWYYLKDGGAMATGWQYVGGAWYWLESWGGMATGWKHIGDSWYYLTGSGAMATGWQYVGGSWYLLGSGGNMLTGWQYAGGNWYWLDSSGAMATGWLNLSGTWYWLDDSGIMATGSRWIDGTLHRFNGSGVWLG